MPLPCSIGKSINSCRFITFNYRKGYINSEDLKEVFKLLGETVTDEEVNSNLNIIMTVFSNDKDSWREIE